MNQLFKTLSAQHALGTSFDPSMMNYEYIEQVLSYIQLGRFDNEQLQNVVPLFLKFTNETHQIANCETIFVGLCSAFQVKPDHFLAYMTGRTLEDVEHAKQCAIHYISKME